MKKFVSRGISNSLIMLASSIGFFAGVAGFLESRQPLIEETAGWRHLSVPVECADSPGWLEGWECLQHSEAAVSSEPYLVFREAAVVEPAVVEEKQEFRIRLFGIVSEERGRVYCLFDTLHRRWFQISSGQADSDAQVRLLRQADREVLEDLPTGDLYLIDSDRYQLVPVRHSPKTDSP